MILSPFISSIHNNNFCVKSSTTLIPKRSSKSMSGKIRPIEKFARAVAQCSTEVCFEASRCFAIEGLHRLMSEFLRRRHMENVLWLIIMQSTRICVQKNL
jgi:hypothetical protein